MPFFLNNPRLVVFNDSFERHPKSSFDDGLQLHPLIDLLEALGTSLLDTPCSSL